MPVDKERAISLLGTAKTMESPVDMRGLIDKALLFLRSEPDVVPGMELVGDMIGEALVKLQKNRPDYADDPDDRAEKMAICESALLQIKDYAAMGLKIRSQGSMDVAEELLRGRANRSLHEFAEVQEMKQFLKENNATAEVKLGDEN